MCSLIDSSFQFEKGRVNSESRLHQVAALHSLQKMHQGSQRLHYDIVFKWHACQWFLSDSISHYQSFINFYYSWTVSFLLVLPQLFSTLLMSQKSPQNLLLKDFMLHLKSFIPWYTLEWYSLHLLIPLSWPSKVIFKYFQKCMNHINIE